MPILRLIHTSDWHLGHELHGFDRGVEHDAFLDWLAGECLMRAADALIVTGDIYDTVNPPLPAQRRLYGFLRRVLAENPALQIVLIGGNHDSAGRVELPRPLLDAARVTLIGALPRRDGLPDPAASLVVLGDADGMPRAICAAIPYLRPGDLPPASDGEDALRALYAAAAIAAATGHGDLPLILTGHLHLSGGAVSELSERRILVGGEAAVGAAIFPPGAAYVALGHLHRPQAIAGPVPIRYAGSPLPMSAAEKDYRHSIAVVDLDEQGRASAELVAVPRAVDFLRLPASGALALEALEAALQGLALADPGPERRPFLEVAVRLDGAEPELRQRIEAALAGKPVRLTRVLRETAGTGGSLADRTAAEATLDELGPAQVFARCHEAAHGGAPPEGLARAFDEILLEVLAPAEPPAAAAS